jgi:hypothetical protein
MFDQNQDDQQVVVPPPQDLTDATSTPNNGVVIPEPDDANVIKPDTASTPEPEPEPQVQSAPTVPQNQDDDLVIPEDIEEEDIAPATTPKPEIPQVTVDEEGSLANLPSLTGVTDSPNSATDDLSELKHKALEALSPLVDELDQEPEEKFSTTMMLIQASENKDLLPKAYEAAQTITDDKARAQALLDVVNEINYFSQSK